MRRLFAIITFATLFLGLNSCTKEVDTSVSLEGTKWEQVYGTESKVELSFTNIEFSLTYTVYEKNDNWLPGEGYRIKGSYSYASPEASLYSRSVEFLFNGKVESVDACKDEFRVVVVDDVLTLYLDNESFGSLYLVK